MFESKTFNFSDNTSGDIRGNNMSDIDSNVGYNRDRDRDRDRDRSRIDDQLEARIFSSENVPESSEARPQNGSKTSPSQPYVTAPSIPANYGPYGGPSFGPFEGPVFGFSAAPDRWSELGSRFQPEGPNTVGTPRGAEYSTPVGLQFYSPFWSQVHYQADDVFAKSYMVTKLQVESDRWSGRWHNVGSPGPVSCNSRTYSSENHTIKIMNIPNIPHVASESGLAVVTGFGLSLMHPQDCSIRDHECRDARSPGPDMDNNDIRNKVQHDENTRLASVISSTVTGGELVGKNEDVIIDLIVIYPNDKPVAETQQSGDVSVGGGGENSSSGNNGHITVGKTYAEAVINKKELIKEIEEERKRQEVNLFCLISSRPSQESTDITIENNVNRNENERENNDIYKGGGGGGGSRPINLYFGSENSVSDGKTLVQSVGSNPSKIICIMENSNVSVINGLEGKSASEVEQRLRGDTSHGIVMEGHNDDEFKDETEELDRQERRKNLKSYSVSLTTLNLASPGKAMIPPPKPNTILSKISTIINNDNNNNINPVNTLFSVLSLTTSSAHTYSLQPPNSASTSTSTSTSTLNSTSTFGNESSSFNSTYTNSKLLIDNNKNYYFNNIHNNYKPVNNNTATGSFNNSKTLSSSSGNLQKLNNTHNPKSVKRHGSLNSISNYGGTNFPGCNSPLKQKMKNTVLRNGVRDCSSRNSGDVGSNPAEDNLLQSDELHTQYSAKIRTFVEVRTCTYINVYVCTYIQCYKYELFRLI